MSAQVVLREEFYAPKSNFTLNPHERSEWSAILKGTTYVILDCIFDQIQRFRHPYRALSYSYIAQRVRRSRRTVMRSIKELTAYGVVIKKTTKKSNKEHETNVYQINFDVLCNPPIENKYIQFRGCIKDKEGGDKNPASSLGGGDKLDVTGGDSFVTELKIGEVKKGTTPKPPLAQKTAQTKEKPKDVVVFSSLEKLNVTEEFMERMMNLKKETGERYAEEEINTAVQVTLQAKPRCLEGFFRSALIDKYVLNETEESRAIQHKELTYRLLPEIAKRPHGYSDGLMQIDVLSKGVEFVRGNIVEFLEYGMIDFETRLKRLGQKYGVM